MNQTVHFRTKATSKRTATTATEPTATSRTNDPARTMAQILQVATHEFAQLGLAGARVDAIAEQTQTSKRMIYYYFGSKEGLYLAVLEDAYRRIRQTESELHLDDLQPPEALRRLVIFTFDHHSRNQDFVRLVMAENINKAHYLAQIKPIQALNAAAVETVRKLYDRGVSEGVFRKGLDPLDIHAAISALSVFNVANQYTFGLIFRKDTQSAASIAARRESAADMVLRFVQKAVA